MRLSAQSPSPHHGDEKRTSDFILVLLAIGIFLYGYGFTVAVGFLPVGWGVTAVFQNIILALGALLVSLMGSIMVWRWRQGKRKPFNRKQLLTTIVVAPLVSILGALIPYWLRAGTFSLPQFMDLTLIGLGVVSVQLLIGTVDPVRRRRAILLAEAIIVFVVVFGFLTVDRQGVNLTSYLFVSGGATVLLIIFGGPLYLLGNRLTAVST